MTEQNADYGIWNKVIGDGVEINRYGVISALLIIVGCLGGVAVGLGAIHSYLQLTLIVAVTMASLSTILAVSPMKLIMNLAVVAIVVDLGIIIFNLIA